MNSIVAGFLVALAIAGNAAFIPRAAASVVSCKRHNNSVAFTLDRGVMNVKICRADVVEVQYTTSSVLPSKSSLVVRDKHASLPVFTVAENERGFVIATERLTIAVSRSTNAIRFADLNGTTILEEAPRNGKRVTPDTVAGIATNVCQTTFLSPRDEGLYGLGCHPEDSLAMNYKGRNQDLAIRYMTGAIPVLLSTRGYGLFWDNYSASKFFGSEENDSQFRYVSESGDMVDYYFIYGPDFDRIIESERELTGHAPMFPKWAFGLFQSQDRYNSQSEVLSVKDAYRKNVIPVDCIVQDWFYWEPDVIGSHRMWPARYPDPKAMVDELHRANIHAMISIWPVLATGTRNYEAMANAGLMTSITWDNVMTHTFDGYYDAHSAAARAMYWQQARDSLIGRDGWDAWWVDQCEPDNGTLFDARKQTTFATGKGIDFFNTYSLMHSQGLYEHWRKDIPGKRAFFLIRQAFAGQQRNATTLWSSDITCTFEALKIQVSQGINACVSGMPYWTSDIGGYHYHWNAPEWSAPANRELFVRWFEFGAFCPVFRIHGKGERALFSDNWDGSTKAILLKYDNLRYRLMPYLYSLGWKVTNESYTIMRALAFDFRTDPAINTIGDEYMFGPAFLVTPVTDQRYTFATRQPVDTTRMVYLPAGATWYDFWTGVTVSGGQSIQASAPLETIPLYIRAGSILPMGPYLQYATEKPADPIELRVYTGDDGAFTLYEDENDGYKYEQGIRATIPFWWSEKTGTLTIGDRTGSFPGMVEQRTFTIVWVRPRHGAGMEPETRVDASVAYNGRAIEVKKPGN